MKDYIVEDIDQYSLKNIKDKNLMKNISVSGIFVALQIFGYINSVTYYNLGFYDCTEDI